MFRKQNLILVTTLAAAFTVAPIGNISINAAGTDGIIEPEAYMCEPSWGYRYSSSAYKMQWSKASEGTHFINQTSSNLTYTSQVTSATTISTTVSGSIQGGFGPIEAELGIAVNNSITITSSDSTAIIIPPKYEGWNEYGTKKDSNTGWYFYLNSDCSESNGHNVTTVTPRVKAVVARTKYVGTI